MCISYIVTKNSRYLNISIIINLLECKPQEYHGVYENKYVYENNFETHAK